MSPRYKVRVPDYDDVLSSECGDHFALTDSDEAARELLGDWLGEPVVFVHPVTVRYSAVYARDIENREAFDGAEPGDTMWTIRGGDPKGEHERRAWAIGAPQAHWEYDYLPPESVDWRDIPVGVPCHYEPEGFGRVCAPPRAWRNSGKPLFPILFENGARRDLFLGQFSLHFGGPMPVPPRRVRVRVAGDVVVEACSEQMARMMVDLRTTRLRAEWEAEQFATLARDEVAA